MGRPSATVVERRDAHPLLGAERGSLWQGGGRAAAEQLVVIMSAPAVLHKYWKTAALSATAFVGDSPLFLLDYLLRFLRVAVLLSLWRVILAGRGATAGMTIGSVLTYTLIAEVFGEQLACQTGIDEAIWDGTIA